jgi:hypothetical protein
MSRMVLADVCLPGGELAALDHDRPRVGFDVVEFASGLRLGVQQAAAYRLSALRHRPARSTAGGGAGVDRAEADPAAGKKRPPDRTVTTLDGRRADLRAGFLQLHQVL